MDNYHPRPDIAAVLHPPSIHENGQTVHRRVTKGGRILYYVLEVIQQPERARACGSGPKSSADRRPVDPPPVLMFQVREGPDFEKSKIITSDYNADFFVFASLENSRPIAAARGQSANVNTPVLTGFPVSGCSYLERPEPAGYFIFPDLSVRHEGFYRLVFTLYEQVKDPADEVENDDGQQGFYHRMAIKSSEFTVWSAKKFPGLASSTALSRLVAEQGCRVRIRRDVRMRKRNAEDGKGKSGDNEQQKQEELAGRSNQTPVPRHRSISSTTSADHAGFAHPADQSRRPSGEYGAPPSVYPARPESRHSAKASLSSYPLAKIQPAPSGPPPISPSSFSSPHSAYAPSLVSPSSHGHRPSYDNHLVNLKREPVESRPLSGYPQIIAKPQPPPLLPPMQCRPDEPMTGLQAGVTTPATPLTDKVPGTPGLRQRLDSHRTLPPLSALCAAHNARDAATDARPRGQYLLPQPQSSKRVHEDETMHPLKDRQHHVTDRVPAFMNSQAEILEVPQTHRDGYNRSARILYNMEVSNDGASWTWAKRGDSGACK